MEVAKNIECDDVYNMFFYRGMLMIIGGSRGFYSKDEKALIEFNPGSRSSRLLLNPRSGRPSCGIDGQPIINACPDAKGEKLYVVIKPDKAAESSMLYLFDPATFSAKKLEDINPEKKISMLFPFYQLCTCKTMPTGMGALFYDYGHCVLVDGNGRVSIMMSNDPKWKPAACLKMNEQLVNNIASVSGGKLLIGRNWYEKGLYLFEKGGDHLGMIEVVFNPEPEKSEDSSLNAMTVSGDNLLFLSPDLFFVCRKYLDGFKD